MIETVGVGGNDAVRRPGHWLVDARQANPMSAYPDCTDLQTGAADGREGFAPNVRAVAAHREAVGPEFRLLVDCYVSIDMPYALELARAFKPYGLYWIEAALHSDDREG